MSDKRMRGRAWPRLLLLIALLVSVGALIYGWNDFARFGTAPLNVATQGDSIDIGRGSSFKGIVGELRQRGFSSANPLYWRLLAEQMHVAGKLHAGEYALEPGITPRQLLANMAAGRVLQRHFTIVDGWTFGELRQALARAEKLNHDSAALDDAAVMQKIGAGGEAPEGRFLPETYAYVKGDSDLDILRRAHAAMVKTLDELWPGRAQNLPLATPYEALILASIVEKETGKSADRPLVASVLINRLKLNMRLQTDPTVIYGLGERFDGNLRKRDLETDTTYNTYTREGLPPTPIALPSQVSLDAATRPAATEYLYFVSRGDGTSEFSTNLNDHARAVNRYQKVPK